MRKGYRSDIFFVLFGVMCHVFGGEMRGGDRSVRAGSDVLPRQVGISGELSAV